MIPSHAFFRRGRRALVAAAATALALGFAAAAHAQGPEPFPGKPVKIVIPYPPGGPTDITARIVAVRLGKELGQSVVIENRPSVAGAVATEQVARGAADGYTVLAATTSNMVGAPVASPELVRYDPIKDFHSVGIVSLGIAAVYAHSSLGVDSAEALLQLARTSPEPVAYGMSGVGTTSHLAVATFERHYKLKMLPVPYKGSGQTFTDLIAGHVKLALADVGQASEYVKRGVLKPLFIAGQTRRDDMPGVPSMADLGMTSIDLAGWNGFFVPTATPAAVREKLASAVRATMADADVQRQIRDRNLTPMYLGEADSLARIKRETAAYSVALPPIIAAVQANAAAAK